SIARRLCEHRRNRRAESNDLGLPGVGMEDGCARRVRLEQCAYREHEVELSQERIHGAEPFRIASGGYWKGNQARPCFQSRGHGRRCDHWNTYSRIRGKRSLRGSAPARVSRHMVRLAQEGFPGWKV